MEFLALLVFIIVQIIFIPLAIFGLILITVKQLFVSKNLGVSSTAISVIGNRWVMDVFSLRKDAQSVRLYRALPNGSVMGLWTLYFPSYLRYKISGRNRGSTALDEVGTEGAGKLAITRTMHFDKLLRKSIGCAEQFVVMGAGYDTRCYGEFKSNRIKFFELDQPKTQRLKINSLKRADIDASHVTFVEVDFSKENWYGKLKYGGYDPAKKTIFLWEGVTSYLNETDVYKTLKEIKAYAAAGSIVLTDLYDSGMVAALKGVKTTNEAFSFGLDFSAGHERVLKEFVESAGLTVGDFYFMGHKTKRGAYGVVAEMIL